MESTHDEATAYHEAGHAVAALALGRPVDHVSVLPDRERLGQCEFKKPAFRPSFQFCEAPQKLYFSIRRVYSSRLSAM